MEVIRNLPKYFQNLCSEKQLERLGGPLILNTNAGKTLNQLNIEPAAHIHEAAFEDQVGGNASERYQVTYQDKRGFSTPEEYVNDRPTVIDEVVNAERNPDHEKVLEANKELLKKNAEGSQAKGVDAAIWNEFDLVRYWVSLPESTEAEVEKKKIFVRPITGRKEDGKLVAGRFDNMKKLIDSYRVDLETSSDADRKDTIKGGNTSRECLNAYHDPNDYGPLSKRSRMIVHYTEARKPSREALEGIEVGKIMLERYFYEPAVVVYNNN